MAHSPIAEQLLNWYKTHARDLPWRGHPDPYAVWVSEIMLQQTRVDTVIPYFERWMAAFPTIQSLADASQQEVLKLWEGLGYYSRARNLHRAADMVIKTYGGNLPGEPRELMKLPGIGHYTSAAIASIAFGKDEAALDGNIRRVLARLFNIDVPARSTDGENQLWVLAESILPQGNAGDHNQALMDLGAVICTPRSPDCPNCPVADHCQAYELGIQEERPVMEKKTVIPHFTVTAAVLQQDGKILIAQRPQDGLLGGLWEFPGGKQEPGETLEACLSREISEELDVEIKVGALFGTYQHAYTHFRITLHAFHCQITGGKLQPTEHSDVQWVTPAMMNDFPMGKIDREIAERLNVEHTV